MVPCRNNMSTAPQHHCAEIKRISRGINDFTACDDLEIKLDWIAVVTYVQANRAGCETTRVWMDKRLQRSTVGKF